MSDYAHHECAFRIAHARPNFPMNISSDRVLISIIYSYAHIHFHHHIIHINYE